MANELKPGYQTTELYGYGSLLALGVAAAKGYLSPELLAASALPGISEVINVATDGVMRVGGLVIAGLSMIKYGVGRAAAKKAPDRVFIKK